MQHHCKLHQVARRSVNDKNCIATQSFNLDVCTLLRLRNVSREIFYFIFGQLWHHKISMKQQRKLLYYLLNTSDYALLSNKTCFQSVFFQVCTEVHYFRDHLRIKFWEYLTFRRKNRVLGWFMKILTVHSY